ncbi:hypothetical protein DI09_58p70 [Mitosporidium daphniae]|uniref:THO complex subunitTHOC2 C-terminal domain-containing protein n=1 Tax=Mitosporidium daphniae TaxID=1485682 RepID=A0A098VP48_9MICR|nr:uncharacterized protein DI09_58p70 [Mitosporidium daphniae]KGG50735.1 hypothetical protein DI09_58p70 [Mitosporidium daphniae]|eukprot:XP_013237176.1 uncharacterized protein DI09_58p70 [Mitosporidium daphniae]
MDLGPFLQYLASITNSDDPGLLADLYAFLPGILSRIGGIPPILEELSASQISCLAGGKLLKFCSQQCPSDYFATRHSVPRILQAATPHLICQLWISLALLPIRLVSVERGGHVKALSWLIDSLCRTFLQFTEAVSIWIKSEDDVPDLRSQMIDILFPSPMNVDFASGDDSVLSCFCSQTGLDLSRAMLIINTLSMEEKPNYRIVDGIFWKLSLSNIKFPESEYDRLIALLEEQPFSSSHSLQGKRDRVMLASLRSSILAEKLLQESLLFKFDSQDCRTKEHSYCIDRGLCCWQSEFDILERAIIPRVLLSLSDAIFCAYWIQKCHEAEWPLSTLILLDRLFGVSIVLLSGLSLQESINFGRFLRVILEWLSSISHINIQDLPSEAVDTLAFAYSVSGHKLGFCPHIRRTRRMVLNTASVDSNLESARICTEPSASPIVNDENISATSELVLGSDPSENAAEETPTCDGYANSSCLHASSEDAAATRSTKFCSMLSNATSAATSDPLSFSQFGSVFRKWHIKLYRSFAKVLNLTSHCRENYTSYCRTRNALVVLTLLVDSVFPVLDTHGMGLERLISPLATTSKDSTSSSNDNEDIRLLAKRCLSLLRARSVCWISSVSTATSAGAVTSANAAPDIKTPVLSSPLLDLSSANSIALPVTATMAATPEPVELAPVQKQILEKIKDVVNSSPSKKESSSKPPSAKDTILKEPYKSSSKSEPSKKESSSIKEERMRGAPFPRGPLKERRSGQADVPRSNVPGDSLRPGVNESSRAPIGDSTAHHRSHRFEDEDRSSSSSSSSRPAIRSFSSSSSSSDRKRRQDPRMPSRRY